MESVDSTSEDGECSLHARVVFSSSEMSTIIGPSDESASGEFGRELSRLALLLACAEWLKKSVILDVHDTTLPNVRPHAIMNSIKWLWRIRGRSAQVPHFRVWNTVIRLPFSRDFFVCRTSGNRTPGSRFYSDLLDTLADSVCIQQLVLKHRSKWCSCNCRRLIHGSFQLTHVTWRPHCSIDWAMAAKAKTKHYYSTRNLATRVSFGM